MKHFLNLGVLLWYFQKYMLDYYDVFFNIYIYNTFNGGHRKRKIIQSRMKSKPPKNELNESHNISQPTSHPNKNKTLKRNGKLCGANSMTIKQQH